LDDYKCYDEIDSGAVYHLFQQKIAGKKDAVQIPLIFLFSDGTVFDKLADILLNHSCLLLEYSSKH